MKLILYACVNDAQHVRKEWGTGEKGMLEQVRNDSQTGETLMFCR
jgi:hypothetical protein|nr:hypothetical protein [uncultured Prevotella sp.]